MQQRPLADEIRPKTLDEVVGQKHLLAPGAVLRRLIEGGASVNMVFYGPSGTGKTTVANIVAERTKKTLFRLNATTATLQDVKDIIANVGTLLAPGGPAIRMAVYNACGVWINEFPFTPARVLAALKAKEEK